MLDRPERGRGGSSIATRFPTAVPFTDELLHDLYTDIGLSARQIELLTGQPHEQILDVAWCGWLIGIALILWLS